jgi:hypothetical protein
MNQILRFSGLLVLFFIFSNLAFAQGVAVNTDGSNADNSAMLDVQSTNAGILVPRLTQAQRDAISNPATGLMVFQTNNTSGFYYNAGTAATPSWIRLSVPTDNFDDADADATNEIQSLSISGHNITLSDGGGVVTVPDNNTTYSAGNQLSLTGTTFDVSEGSGSGLDGDMVDGQHWSDIQSWVNTNDNNTTYTAGNQLTLTGTTLDVTEGSGSDLDGDMLDGLHGSQYTRSDVFTETDFNSLTANSRVTSINASSNTPFGSAWYTVFNNRHRGGSGDGISYGSQIAIGMTNYRNRVAFRTHSSGTWSGWSEIWTAGSDGSGSGMDADLLDGHDWSEIQSNDDYLPDDPATSNVDMNDFELQRVKALQGIDWDDNSGGADNKYRLLFRDGAHQFYNGGVVVGSYGNGTWTDLTDGRLIVEDRIGIGTTSPAYKLDVRSSDNFDGAVAIYGESPQPGQDLASHYTYGVRGSVTSGKGNAVGIYGVSGGGGGSSGRGSGVKGFAGGSTSGYNYGVHGLLESGTGGAAILGRDLAVSWGGNTGGSYAGYFVGDVNIDGDLNVSGSFPSDSRWTLSGINLYPDNIGWNVGIGTSSPNAKLHVAGDVTTGRQGVAGTYNSTQVQGIWSIGDAYRIDQTNNTFGDQYGIVYAHTNAGVSGSNKPIAGWGHQVLFTTNGTRKAAISLSYGNAYFEGNVGIGTTTPESKLDVNGELAVTGLTSTPAASKTTMGWETVYSSGSGSETLFQHPEVNITIVWDGTNDELSVVNNSGSYWDVTIIRYETNSGSNAYSISSDVSNGSTLSLTTSNYDHGWQIIAVDEDGEGPGFILNATGWSSDIQGLVQYWRNPN